MLELIVGNSYSQVKGLTTESYRGLRKLLSYQPSPNAAFYSGSFKASRPSYLIDAKGCFPTGLLSKVQGYLHGLGVPYPTTSSRTPPISDPTLFKLNLGDTLPYQAQVEAVDSAIRHGRGIISAPTGSGKSLIIAVLVAKLGVRTLIIVPTVAIREQLQDSLDSLIGKTDYIQVYNIDSPELKHKQDFDCLIIDEAHHVAAKTYRTLNKSAWTKIYHRFFLTATPFRNRNEEQLLFESIAGQVIYELSYKEAVKSGYIVPVEAYYLDLPKTPTDAYTWAEVYRELVVENKARNEAIADVLTSLRDSGKSVLCLVKEIKHGEALAALTGFPFANGQDEDTEYYIKLFNSGRLKYLIGTAGILGEGVDTKPAEYVVIAGLGKAKSAFMQQVGRGVRRYEGKESCKIILIRDRSHKFSLRHFREQCRILKDEYGVTAIKLG